MIEQVGFIKREQELAQIADCINQSGTTCVICIDAPGGIGKTRLVQEVHRRYAELASEEVSARELPLVTDIVDFDALDFHFSENVERRIAHMLGDTPFQDYFAAVLDLRRMEEAGVSVLGVAKQKEVASEAFVSCFNRVSSKQRAMLLFDTTEQMPDDVQDYLIQVFPRFENCVSLLAGRNSRVIGDRLQSLTGLSVLVIDLKPFDESASEQYLQQKLALLHGSLHADQVQQILLLADGRPILIDLAVEWLSRNVHQDWECSMDVATLRKLAGEQLQAKREDFERDLVSSISQTHQPMDWLLFAMSHVYPIELPMVAPLLDISPDEAAATFEESKTYVFVKTLPDGRIKLHDEMRQMVKKHVWFNVDPDGRWRQFYSRTTAEYLSAQIETLQARITELSARLPPVSFERVPFALRERYLLERELLTLETQRLRHILAVNLTDGVRVFIDAFDRATSSYNYHSRKFLLDEMLKYVDKLDVQQRCEVRSRQAAQLNYMADYAQAEQITTQLLAEGMLSAAQRFDLRSLRANARIRLGQYGVAIEDFQAAVDIANELQDLARQARAYNALGWAYRKKGHFRQAIEFYGTALNLSVKAGDDPSNLEHRGWILNNMVYARGHIEGLEKSVEHEFKLAEALWEQLGNRRGKGALYAAYMMFKRHKQEYDEALRYGDEAWSIFNSQNDVEWLSRVRYEQGKAYLRNEKREDRFERARRYLDQALSYHIAADEAEINYWLVEACIATGDVEQAKWRNQEGAQKAAELHYVLHYLSQTAHIADLRGETACLDNLVAKYRAYEDRYPEAPRTSPAQAVLFYYLGNIALRCYSADLDSSKSADRALEYYRWALPNAARHLEYGPYQLSIFLADLDGRLAQSQDGRWVKFRQKLGVALYDTWQLTRVEDLKPLTGSPDYERTLADAYPEAQTYFIMWQRA